MAQPLNPPAETQPKPDPNEKLIKVFEAEEETEVLVVKGLLESAGIESDLAPISLTQYAFPNVGGTILRVREKDAEAAQRLIAEQRQTPLEDDETAEIETIPEPRQKG